MFGVPEDISPQRFKTLKYLRQFHRDEALEPLVLDFIQRREQDGMANPDQLTEDEAALQELGYVRFVWDEGGHLVVKLSYDAVELCDHRWLNFFDRLKDRVVEAILPPLIIALTTGICGFALGHCSATFEQSLDTRAEAAGDHAQN